MGILHDSDIEGWSFEVRPGCVKIYPDTAETIWTDHGFTQTIEMNNDDLVLLHHVLGEIIPKLRPGVPR